MTIAGPGTPIGYGPMGFLTSAGTVDIKVCPISYANKGYGITIQPNGLADVNPDTVCP